MSRQSPRVLRSGFDVKRMALREDAVILPGMPLRGRDVANTAVPVLVVVPVDQARRLAPGVIEAVETLRGKSGAVLGGAEQRFDEGVVVEPARMRRQ